MNLELWQIVLLCVAAFCAGFIDAIVGGGGLVQLPAALVILNSFPVVTVVGSLKIPAFCGTFFATKQYLKKVEIKWSLMTVACTIAFFAAYAGSQTLTMVSNSFMKPVLLLILTAVLIYTYMKDEPTSIGKISKTAMQSLWKFQKKLSAIGHFWTEYNDIEHLKRQFSDQPDKLLQDGRI